MRDATFSAVPARVRGVSYAGSTTKRCGWQILASSQPVQRVIAPRQSSPPAETWRLRWWAEFAASHLIETSLERRRSRPTNLLDEVTSADRCSRNAGITSWPSSSMPRIVASCGFLPSRAQKVR